MMHAATLLLGALALAGPQTRDVDERRAYPFEVLRVGSLDTPRLTIRADNAPVERVMLKVAHELGRELKGFDAIMRRPDVTARLEGEPAKDAVRWVLGSVGLRAVIDQHEIYVMEDVSAFPDPEELLKRANTRYLRALIDFPDFPDADHAEFARGQVNEALGGEFTSDAIYSYDSLVENYPRSTLAADALYRAARLLRTQGDNQGASERYERLAELESGHELHADARLELALSLCKLAEQTKVDGARLDRAHKALYVLDALDDRIVTRTDQERRERLLVRARALALTEKPIDALKALDLAARYSQGGQNDPQMLELRAMALSRAGKHGASSTAWLAYGREQTGDELVRAYVNAAEEALRGGHELATIAIEAQARAKGFADALAVPAGEARARLGLIEKSATELDLMQRIRRGERFLQDEDVELAVQALRPVHAQRGALADEGTVRLAEAYAQALDKNGMFVDAIGVLRTAAGELERVTDRRRIYILASELYERHGHWDKAVDAIQGKL